MKTIKTLSGILVIGLAASCNFANNRHPYGLDTVDKDPPQTTHHEAADTSSGHHASHSRMLAPGSNGSESYNYGDSVRR